MSITSIVPIEDRFLAALTRFTQGQLEHVSEALEDGGIAHWKKLGFESQIEKLTATFIEDVWAAGEESANAVLRWAKTRKGPKPLSGDSEGIVAKFKQMASLTGSNWPEQPIWTFAEKAVSIPIGTRLGPVIGIANVPPEAGLAWYKDYALSLVGVTEQELLDRAKQTIARGADLGLTTREIRGELEQVFDSFPRHRLDNIIRTESSHVYNTSSLFSYTRDPMVTAYRYLVTVDDRTTEICLDYADQVVRAEDLTMVPPAHFRCRTVLEPMFVWEEPKFSDMTGVEPMAGFGQLFPPGTGLPGVKPFRIPTP